MKPSFDNNNQKSELPLVTVVTVALNAEPYIEQTILSVLNQTWRPLEFIVVDGRSTDATPEIAGRYKDHIDHFISEKDDGIADAMNKGLALATGEYIVFLHADDYFENNRSLEQALAFCDETTDILACEIRFGKQLKQYRPRGFTWWFNFKTGLFHQGTICRRALVERLGGFDKRFKIVMDYDFFLRARQARACLTRAPVILSVMRDTGISTRSDWKSLKYRFDEEKRVHEKNCRTLPLRLVHALYWSLYLPYRRAMYVMKNRIIKS